MRLQPSFALGPRRVGVVTEPRERRAGARAEGLASADRACVAVCEQRSLVAERVEVGAVVIEQTLAGEVSQGARADRAEQLRKFFVGQRLSRVKAQLAVCALREYAIEHDDMEVDMKIGDRSKAREHKARQRQCVRRAGTASS